MFSLKLAFKIDLKKMPEVCYSEVNEIIKKFNFKQQFSNYHDGSWKAIGLITSGGNFFEDKEIDSMDFKKTELLLLMPHLNKYLDSLCFEKKRVRIMNLEKGGRIHTHCDSSETYDKNQLRIHIPLVTNNKVKVQILNQSYYWGVGESWYADFSFPHSLENMGESDRYHLVIDCVGNNYIDELIDENYKKQKFLRSICRFLFVNFFKIKQKLKLIQFC